jgi:lambda repressor-like predicted transcriptional regulator
MSIFVAVLRQYGVSLRKLDRANQAHHQVNNQVNNQTRTTLDFVAEYTV